MEEDLAEVLPCEAIVTTGEETGVETSIEKLKDFRREMPSHLPLIVGAGVNEDNSLDQSSIVQGAIIGRGVKFQSNTRYLVDPVRVKAIRKLW